MKDVTNSPLMRDRKQGPRKCDRENLGKLWGKGEAAEPVASDSDIVVTIFLTLPFFKQRTTQFKQHPEFMPPFRLFPSQCRHSTRCLRGNPINFSSCSGRKIHTSGHQDNNKRRPFRPHECSVGVEHAFNSIIALPKLSADQTIASLEIVTWNLVFLLSVKLA